MEQLQHVLEMVLHIDARVIFNGNNVTWTLVNFKNECIVPP